MGGCETRFPLTLLLIFAFVTVATNIENMGLLISGENSIEEKLVVTGACEYQGGEGKRRREVRPSAFH